MSKIQKKQPSKKQTEIRLTEVPKTAVGVKAIASALSHIKNEVGVFKGCFFEILDIITYFYFINLGFE